jgi:hypothetical protein
VSAVFTESPDAANDSITTRFQLLFQLLLLMLSLWINAQESTATESLKEGMHA